MDNENEKAADAAVEAAAPEGKSPSFIFDQEVSGKDGRVFTTKFAVTFQREDGSHEFVQSAQPLQGHLIMRTPEQRLEAMKSRERKPKTQGHER